MGQFPALNQVICEKQHQQVPGEIQINMPGGQREIYPDDLLRHPLSATA